MAIIKKFNRALENLNLEPHEQLCATSDEEESEEEDEVSNQAGSMGT
jgi:hypothetical protein